MLVEADGKTGRTSLLVKALLVKSWAGHEAFLDETRVESHEIAHLSLVFGRIERKGG
jgi:hypothetical protein